MPLCAALFVSLLRSTAAFAIFPSRLNTTIPGGLPSGLQTDALTLVLPARTEDQGGYPRLTTLMRSLTKFFDPAMVAVMLLIVPDRDISTFARHAAFQRLPWPLRTVPDSSILSKDEAQFDRLMPPEERHPQGRGTNYRMQMLTKLKISFMVNTTFYLVLDCGALTRLARLTDTSSPCRARHTARRRAGDADGHVRRLGPWRPRPLRRRELPVSAPSDAMVGGGRQDPASRRVCDERIVGPQPRHRSDAGAACDRDQPRARRARRVVARRRAARGVGRGVDPAAQERRSAARLDRVHAILVGRSLPRPVPSAAGTRRPAASDARLSPVHRRTQACLSGLADALHKPQSSLRLYEESAFDWGAWQSWDASRAFHDDSFVFTVIQSIGGVNPSWVDRQVQPYL